MLQDSALRYKLRLVISDLLFDSTPGVNKICVCRGEPHRSRPGFSAGSQRSGSVGWDRRAAADSKSSKNAASSSTGVSNRIAVSNLEPADSPATK